MAILLTRRQEYYNPYSVAELQALTPSINFLTLFSKLSPDFKINRVIVASPEYMTKLDTIIKETSRETVQAFLVWKLIWKFASKVDSTSAEPIIHLQQALSGTKVQPERWRICVTAMDEDLGWLLVRELKYTPQQFTYTAANGVYRADTTFNSRLVQRRRHMGIASYRILRNNSSRC